MKKIISYLRNGLLRLARSSYLQKILQFTANTLAYFVPVDERLVLCGAMNGKLYGDNSKYVYDWILQQNKNCHAVWITRNRQVYRELKKQGRPVVMSASLSGWLCLLRARAGIFTNSLYDLSILPSLIPDRLALIALRHGRSVKRIRFARQKHVMGELEKQERTRESRLIHYAISTSEMISDMQEECLKIGREKHIVTGYPRNDLLQFPEDSDIETWRSFVGDEVAKNVVLYAPSWRHGREATNFFPFADFSFDKLVEFIDSHNILLLLRPHMNDLFKYPELVDFLSSLCRRCQNIRLASHQIFPDVNSILPFIDILVSDYSALYHDFLLLDRPLLFIPYDYKNFSEQNGFLYDYIGLMPGPRVSSMADFCLGLKSAIDGEDTHKKQRHRLKGMLHQYDDHHSRNRVYELVEQIMETE